MTRRKRQAIGLLLVCAILLAWAVGPALVVVDYEWHHPHLVAGVEIRCSSPVSLAAPVNCSIVEGSPETFEWRAPDGDQSSGNNRDFQTSFTTPGDKTVSLDFCTAGDCETADLSVIVLEWPVVNLACAPSPAPVGQSVSCELAVIQGQADTVLWNVAGTPEATNQLDLARPFPEPGSKTISVKACNIVPDCDTDQVTVEIVQPLKPLVTLSCDATIALSDQSVSCTAELLAGEADSVVWNADGASHPTNRLTFSTPFPEPGAKTITVTACNAAADCDTDVAQLQIVETESQLPVDATLLCTPSTALVGAPVSCLVAVNHGDAESFQWVTTADPNAVLTGNPSFTTRFPLDGDHAVSVEVCNSLGCVTEIASIRVLPSVDSRDPELPPIEPPRVTLTCTPGTSGPVAVGRYIDCTAALGGGTASSIEWTTPQRPPVFSGSTLRTRAVGPTIDSITVQVCNSAGCASDTAQVAVVAPSTVTLVCAPSPVAVDAEVACHASVSGTTQDALSWVTTAGASQSGGTNLLTSFSQAGSAGVYVQACNIAGCSADSAPVTAVAPPAVSLACTPSPVAVGAPVSCSATFPSASGSIVWTTAAGSHPTNLKHFLTSFDSPGAQTIDVTVCNLVELCAADSETIQVLALDYPQPSISCSPLFVNPAQDLTCSAIIHHGPADTITWHSSAGSHPTNQPTFSTSFPSLGSEPIHAVACNALGCSSSNTVHITVTDDPLIPLLEVSPAALTFEDPCTYDDGELVHCPDSISQPLTLTNVGGGLLSITSASVSPAVASLSVDASDCDSPLDPHQTCSLTVSFVPHAAGSVMAHLLIQHSASNSPTSIPVEAHGSPAPMTIEFFDVEHTPGACFCDAQMWLDISFRVTGDPAGHIELWRKKIGHVYAQVEGDFTVDQVNQLTLSQDDDEDWKYQLRATNSVDVSATPVTVRFDGTNQCFAVE